jgi:hypothetical protein
VRAITAAGLLLAVASCRTQLYELRAPEPDGGAAPPVAAPDLAVAPTGCMTHTLTVVPLIDLAKVDGPATPTAGAVLRVRVGVPVRDGCDVLGSIDVQVSIGNATDGAQITAHVWRGNGGPCNQERTVSRVLNLESTNQRIFVSDAAPGGRFALTFTLAQPTTRSCAPAPQCTLDCQCSDQCVYTGEVAGVCARSCSEDVDCAAPSPHCRPTGIPSWICDAAPAGGSCDPPCSLGQSCQGGVCRPLNPPLEVAPCACDYQCGPGRICDQATRVCVIPCVTVADCPPGRNVCNSACADTR